MESSLRIALYHNLHSGGAKRIVAEHLELLPKRHQLTLFSLNSADHNFATTNAAKRYREEIFTFQRTKFLASPFGRLNPLLSIIDVMRLDAVMRQVAAQIDREEPDVVLVHPCQITQAPSLLRHLKTPSLYYCQELIRRLYEPPIPRPYQLDGASTRRGKFRSAANRLDPFVWLVRHFLKTWDRGNARSAGLIVCNSKFSAGNIAQAYGRSAELCYPGVEVEPLRQDLVSRESIVLSVGSLTPSKGFDFVIRSLATIPLEKGRPKLVIISNFQETAEKDYLSELARECEVNVTMLKNVPEAELQNWYSRAGCLACASVREPFGLTALEGMAAGIPVVAVAEGGLNESVQDGVTGFVAPRDPERYGSAIYLALTDVDLSRSLVVSAHQQVAQNWSLSQHLEVLEQLLKRTARLKDR